MPRNSESRQELEAGQMPYEKLLTEMETSTTQLSKSAGC